MFEQLHFLAPAKINLFLHILGRNPNGYHQLQTIFQKVSWFDELDFRLIASDHIELITNFEGSPQNNLVFKAAILLKDRYAVKQGIEICLRKNLPAGGGLGGGSSDAGTTLTALNQIWQLDLPLETLLEHAKELGADVPFFVLNQTAWGEGIGEILTPIHLPKQWYLILYPNCHSDTKTLYTHPDLPRNTPAMHMLEYDFSSTHNDFEALACQLYPPIQQAKEWLSQFGPARLTGSGSCLFLPIENEAQGNEICKQAPNEWQCVVCHSL